MTYYDPQKKWKTGLGFAASIARHFVPGAGGERPERDWHDPHRRKDEFLAILAHELRNPLAPIRNAVHIMNLQGASDPVTKAAAEMIERQLRHMARLIDDISDISRVTNGKFDVRKERVSLETVIEQALEISRPCLEHELTVTLPTEPVYLEGDPVRLAQIFSNLLNNAFRYTEAGGEIWLTAERRNANVAVTIKDSGIGIAAADLPCVFDMFSQVSPQSERSQGGLGIGLALVKILAELHGGTVEAHSAGRDLGSEFTVRLPVAGTAGAEHLYPDDSVEWTEDQREESGFLRG